MEGGNGYAQKRSWSHTGLGLGAMAQNKKPHSMPDFSALPTHLPGMASSFAPTKSPSLQGPSSPHAVLDQGSINNDVEPAKQKSAIEKSLQSDLSRSATGDSNNSTESAQPKNDNEKENPNDKSASPTHSEPQKDVTKQVLSKPDKEPVFIEGTNITLQTEEDIAKWIAERRKKWPTRKNVEAKLEQQKEKTSEPDKGPKKQAVCKFYARNNRCKFGAKCRNAHEAGTSKVGPQAQNQSGNSANATSSTRKLINGVLVNIPQRYKKEVSGSGNLYTKLVQRDLYEHENNTIIEFIQYLDSQGLIAHNSI